MNTQAEFFVARTTIVRAETASGAEGLSETSAAFGLAAAITILFNTLLAWVKDAYEPLNTAMAHLTGHHWITHGLVDVALFIALGVIFTKAGIGRRINPDRLVLELMGAVVVAGLGLAAWFVLV